MIFQSILLALRGGGGNNVNDDNDDNDDDDDNDDVTAVWILMDPSCSNCDCKCNADIGSLK